MADTTIVQLLALVVFVVALVSGEDDHGTNTVSYDKKTFEAGIAKGRNFVMFYAPWCGHCKNLAPTWDQLANVYNKKATSPVVIAKVDCTVQTGLCADHEIVGFPTLKLFEAGGESHKRYTGKRDLESLKAFVQDNLQGEEGEAVEQAPEGKPEVPEPKSALVTLTDDTFAEHVAEGGHFVKFYAPWCGHCKKLAPVWEELAETFGHVEDVSIAMIDCTRSQVICKQYEIRGYPTLVWFVDGKQKDKYQGARTHEALKKFVAERMEEGSQEGEEEEDEGEEENADDLVQVAEGKVLDLNQANFKAQLKASSLIFIKFFAPWCGHCKRLAPTWDELAKHFADEEVAIAKVDCTQHKSVCDDYQVRGYPTLKMFRDGEVVNDYRGPRALEDLSGYVKKYLEENHDELLISSHLILPSRCGHCKRLAPTWDELAKHFADEEVAIAKVDCTQHKSVCDDYQVRGYPTLKMFRDGEVVNDYRGPRALEDLSGFVKKYLEENHDEL
ncbi:thioredoxin domain-containing protein 5 homolog [Aplysia californica]|uniref:Thioredoxin domain-containing protein 5 homolog n=1 Tax=Aplysia californica TaxID=6500 RepID=A0ABM1W2F1_APLCA|nr:thioredoxin domain-containing protein 5 homolog [Aplysia californica]